MLGRDACIGQCRIDGGDGHRSDSAVRESTEWRHANAGY
jgi:hypothetical protein